jgi:hypothetical protein
MENASFEVEMGVRDHECYLQGIGNNAIYQYPWPTIAKKASRFSGEDEWAPRHAG